MMIKTLKIGGIRKRKLEIENKRKVKKFSKITVLIKQEPSVQSADRSEV